MEEDGNEKCTFRLSTGSIYDDCSCMLGERSSSGTVPCRFKRGRGRLRTFDHSFALLAKQHRTKKIVVTHRRNDVFLASPMICSTDSMSYKYNEKTNSLADHSRFCPSSCVSFVNDADLVTSAVRPKTEMRCPTLSIRWAQKQRQDTSHRLPLTRRLATAFLRSIRMYRS